MAPLSEPSVDTAVTSPDQIASPVLVPVSVSVCTARNFPEKFAIIGGGGGGSVVVVVDHVVVVVVPAVHLRVQNCFHSVSVACHQSYLHDKRPTFIQCSCMRRWPTAGF